MPSFTTPNLSVRSFTWRVRYAPQLSWLASPPAPARRSAAAASCILLLGGLSGPPTRRSRSRGETYCVPEIHCMLEIVGRGGHCSSGLIKVSGDCWSGFPVPQTWITVISLGPVQPNTSPVCATNAGLVGSIMESCAWPRSFSPGIEYARAVWSSKKATTAKP